MQWTSVRDFRKQCIWAGKIHFQLLSLCFARNVLEYDAFWDRLGIAQYPGSDTGRVALLKLSRSPPLRSFEFDEFALLQICQRFPYIRGERFRVGFIFFG